MSRPLAVIEAAYTRYASDEAWLRHVGEAVADALAMNEGGGVAYFVRWRPRGLPETSGWLRVGRATEEDLAFARAQHEVPIPEPMAEEASRVYARGALLIGTREALGEVTTRFEAIHGSSVERTGSVDTLNLVCMDATHAGVTFIHPSPDRVRTHPRKRALWTRIAAHVTAGLRMQRGAARAGLAEADAILDVDGRVLDASPGAATELDALRRAARDVDRARLRGTDDEHALELWQCLFSGAYSVVDRFDTDGKRLFVAKRNAPEARGPRALSERERQVVALVSVGHSDKSAAYELGLAEGTVATHLHAALKKLGLTSTSDLALLRTSLAGDT
ncbi:MAG: helix-turn-helix transcriptional regulator [Polyangiaceae bacterium]